MKSLLFCMFFLFSVCLLSQVTDDFNDGDFTSDPPWYGDENEFVVNDDAQLQLNSQGEDESWLGTAFQMGAENEWRFWIKLSFDPSSNNNARVYLISDQQNLEGDLNGYFVQFGESGSDDAIELFRQEGTEAIPVCRGTDGLISSSFEMDVRVRQDIQGNWTVEIDETGAGAYITEAEGFDNTFALQGTMGVVCKYTSSNSDNFYFDDFYAGPHEYDTDPPQLLEIDVTDEHNLTLVFNEALAQAPAGNIQNYFVSNGVEIPLTAELNNENPARVHLSFFRAFVNGETHTISIENMEDLAGNVAPLIESQFLWFKPGVFQIQINELMVDPTPPVQLPEWEYLEIYNTTEFPVSLLGWKLIIGSTEKVFEDVSIEPGGYLLVADDDAAGDFHFIGSFYGFSGFSLTNSGQTVVLADPGGGMVSFVEYTDSWYNDPVKEDGGWSLEQIDPGYPCGGHANWTASVSPKGGTPGAENSVHAENPDTTPPGLSRVEIISSNEIILHFSEPMDSTLLSDNEAFMIDQGIGYPVEARPKWPAYQRAELHLSDSLRQGIIYALTIEKDLTDCAGNLIGEGTFIEFGLPGDPGSGDVVINEVLYNPMDLYVRGVDFVEIYNRSGKIIDLSDMVLAREDDVTGELESVEVVSETGYLFFPEEYLVLTEDPEVVKTQYFTDHPDAFLKMGSLPSYNNDQGVVVLATQGLEVIDRFAYTDEMQYALLNSTDGVSLERINFNRPASDLTNWHSAAEDAGFATPGYRNSQFRESTVVEDPIEVEPEVFSPDNDGIDDVLDISYHFDEAGYSGSITIFDTRGRKVRTLVSNELMGTSGTFSWDGLTDDTQKANTGIYIIFVEVFDLNGNTKRYKKTAVLGTRF